MNSEDLVKNLVDKFASTPRVLVVDDDDHFVTLFRYTLEECGCIVDVTTEPKTAVDKVKYQEQVSKPYDIIFLDLKMPPYHGVVVLEEAKRVSPKTPVIIVTGYPDSDLLAEALKHGYLGMIQKPIDFEEIKLLFWKHKIALQPDI